MAYDWYLRSQYGKSQTRGYLRVITGMPRSFFWLGDNGVLWKRLLFQGGLGAHGLSFARLIIQMAWKLLAVYGFLSLLILELVRRTGRSVLVVLFVAAGPILLFAIVLFEAGPPERYLPVFPMLFLCVAHLLGRALRSFASVGALCFLIAMLFANSHALSRLGLNSRWFLTEGRITALTQQSSPEDLLVLVSFQDDICRMEEERPFDPLARRVPRIYVAAELQSQRTRTWPSDIAKVALETWENGDRVWVSKRLLALHPKLEWNWIEGDDARIHWGDFPAYFSRLQGIADYGGEDGFILVGRTPANIGFLHSHLSDQNITK